MQSPLLMVGIGIFFFYFILWRPEQKRRKAAKEQRNSLKVGDQVTAMGMVGEISKVNEKTVVLKMVEGAKIEIIKEAISEVRKEEKTKAQEAKVVSSK